MNTNEMLKALKTIASAAEAGRQFVTTEAANVAEQFRIIRDAACEAIRAAEGEELEIGANSEREVRNARGAIAMAMANQRIGDSVEREVMANVDADHRWPSRTEHEKYSQAAFEGKLSLD